MGVAWKSLPTDRPSGATTLNGNHLSGVTSLALATGGTAALGTDYPFRITLFNGDINDNEIVIVTEASGDTITLQSVTTKAWSGGTHVQRLLTRSDLKDIQDFCKSVESGSAVLSGLNVSGTAVVSGINVSGTALVGSLLVSSTSDTAINLAGGISAGKIITSAGSASVPSVQFGEAGTGIYHSAAGEISVAISSVQRLKISSSGIVVSSGIQAVGIDARLNTYFDCISTTTSHASYHAFRKAYNSGSGAPGDTVTNETLGVLQFAGYSGSSYRAAAQIYAQQDGASTATGVPGRIVFQTASTAGTLTTVLSLTAAGNAAFSGGVTISGVFTHAGTTVGFYGGAVRSRQTVSGILTSSATLTNVIAVMQSLLNALGSSTGVNLINDTTSR